MKLKIGLFVCLIVTLFFVSCGTISNPYSIQKREAAIIQLWGGVKISYFNNEEVNWDIGLWGIKDIFVPEGEHNLIVSLSNAKQGDFLYSGGQFGFSFYFKEGHKYRLTFRRIINNYEIILNIKDRTNGKNNRITARTVRN